MNFIDPNGKNPVLIAVGIGAAVGGLANLAGAHFAGTLNYGNAAQTFGIGAFAGSAAVLTSGTAALATATTWTALLTAELGSGFVATFVGAGIDLGLNSLVSPPDPYPQTLQPKRQCP